MSHDPARIDDAMLASLLARGGAAPAPAADLADRIVAAATAQPQLPAPAATAWPRRAARPRWARLALGVGASLFIASAVAAGIANVAGLPVQRLLADLGLAPPPVVAKAAPPAPAVPQPAAAVPAVRVPSVQPAAAPSASAPLTLPDAPTLVLPAAPTVAEPPLPAAAARPLPAAADPARVAVREARVAARAALAERRAANAAPERPLADRPPVQRIEGIAEQRATPPLAGAPAIAARAAEQAAAPEAPPAAPEALPPAGEAAVAPPEALPAETVRERVTEQLQDARAARAAEREQLQRLRQIRELRQARAARQRREGNGARPR